MMANASRVIPPKSRSPAKPIKLSPLLPVLGREFAEFEGLGVGVGVGPAVTATFHVLLPEVVKRVGELPVEVIEPIFPLESLK